MGWFSGLRLIPGESADQDTGRTFCFPSLSLTFLFCSPLIFCLLFLLAATTLPLPPSLIPVFASYMSGMFPHSSSSASFSHLCIAEEETHLTQVSSSFCSFLSSSLCHIHVCLFFFLVYCCPSWNCCSCFIALFDVFLLFSSSPLRSSHLSSHLVSSSTSPFLPWFSFCSSLIFFLSLVPHQESSSVPFSRSVSNV